MGSAGQGEARRHAEERDEGDADAAEVPGVVLAKERDRGDGEEVEDEEEEQHDVRDRAQPADDAHHDHLELRHLVQDLDEPREPEQPQDRDVHRRDAGDARDQQHGELEEEAEGREFMHRGRRLLDTIRQEDASGSSEEAPLY